MRFRQRSPIPSDEVQGSQEQTYSYSQIDSPSLKRFFLQRDPENPVDVEISGPEWIRMGFASHMHDEFSAPVLQNSLERELERHKDLTPENVSLVVRIGQNQGSTEYSVHELIDNRSKEPQRIFLPLEINSNDFSKMLDFYSKKQDKALPPPGTTSGMIRK